MGITDLFVSGYTAKKNTEAVDAGGAVTDTLSTDTTIGTAGAFDAHQRQLSGYEAMRYQRPANIRVERFYADTTGLTVKHWISDPNGELWNIININNPHDLDEFYQIDAERKLFEVENE